MSQFTPRLSRRILKILATVIAVSAWGVGVNVTNAFAVPACDVAPALGVTVTCTFSSGGFTDLVVPSGTASVTIVAIGGSGGANPGLSSGGSGARVSSSVSASSGQTLRVYVGGGGIVGGAGGAGYGSGGNTGAYGGGGGGSSAVLLNGTVITVAGGGGGGGGDGAGGTAGGANGAGGAGAGPSDSDGTPGAGGAGGVGGTAVDNAEIYHPGVYATNGGSGYNASGGTGTGGGGGSTSSGGAGGAGWGGGAGAGYAMNTTSTSGGGGAGGSYGPVGAVFASAANATVLTNGAAGSVQLTFNATSPQTTAQQLPPDIFQGVGVKDGSCIGVDQPGLNWGGSSNGGWGRSWAQWANGGLGGFVCQRTLRYEPTLLHWVTVL